MEAVLQVISTAGRKAPAQTFSAHQWRSMDGEGNAGRYIPCTSAQPMSPGRGRPKTEALASGNGPAVFEQWLLQSTQTLETEINCQLGEVTLNRNHMQVSSAWPCRHRHGHSARCTAMWWCTGGGTYWRGGHSAGRVGQPSIWPYIRPADSAGRLARCNPSTHLAVHGGL